MFRLLRSLSENYRRIEIGGFRGSSRSRLRSIIYTKLRLRKSCAKGWRMRRESGKRLNRDVNKSSSKWSLYGNKERKGSMIGFSHAIITVKTTGYFIKNGRKSLSSKSKWNS